MVPSYTGRNLPAAKGGPSGVQRSSAAQLKETEALFNSYEHLQGLPRGDAALTMLRKVASLVKPIMRKRGWTVQILAEFLPVEQNLLGLNVNKGYKICVRLRYHNHPDLFLPVEQVVDTMLHELSHNVWGDHDSNFHQLWDELRDEHETLVRKGYTGEGFLSEGQRLGGGRHGVPAPHEMRRLAKASAEKRQTQGTLGKGSGQRLGGAPIHLSGGDVRSVIADQVTRRTAMNKGGCASGRGDATKLADQSANNTFKTKAEEDDANDRAIAQALFELMEQEEERKLTNGTFSAVPPDGGLAWSPESGLYDPSKDDSKARSNGNHNGHMSEEQQMRWALRDSISQTAGNNASTLGLSPVSPMSPMGIDRALSAPPIPAQSQSKPVSDDQRLQANSKPVSNLTRDVDDQLTAKRARSSKQSSSSAVPPHQIASSVRSPLIDISELFNPDQWTCDICTCINPVQFLACDACATERPAATSKPASAAVTGTRPKSTASATKNALPRFTAPKVARRESLGWKCVECGSFMEHKWWTCSACGLMKSAS
ncbi:hypothetical protein LTR36_003032 [Oleoguttula mirabilis]|uniref:WLM-domain-containing protein n=1 Tax=Oleoguttula mirabilis TaxID=1507867 RepID=A0AAV9JWY7_9PEZI|nr:hypothetical protein LTR36_003032 [Oleoguttula mirabilis]